MATGCGSNSAEVLEPCPPGGRVDALSTCLKPTRSDAYYIEQAEKYFDTLDSDADPQSIPNYSELVARWEWPPWLKLTGYGKTMMIASDIAVARGATPSTVPSRDCRAFAVQPFARCRVVFAYEGGTCPIYEEFTFNNRGEMTFIEAWSDRAESLPSADPADLWAEGPDVHRLSDRIPGLGNSEGRIDLDADWMLEAAANDPDVFDFLKRANHFWTAWIDALDHETGGDLTEEKIYGPGCGW